MRLLQTARIAIHNTAIQRELLALRLSHAYGMIPHGFLTRETAALQARLMSVPAEDLVEQIANLELLMPGLSPDAVAEVLGCNVEDVERNTHDRP